MKILAISSSPRKGGNSDTLIDCFIDGARQTSAAIEKIRVAELDISPCKGCEDCYATGQCSIDDDMQGLYPKLMDADAVVIASPIYFMSVPAQLKVIIDRCHAIWSRYEHLGQPRGEKRKGYFLSTSGVESAKATDYTVGVIKALFATLGVEYTGELLCSGCDERGAIASNGQECARAREMGRQACSASSPR